MIGSLILTFAFIQQIELPHDQTLVEPWNCPAEQFIPLKSNPFDTADDQLLSVVELNVLGIDHPSYSYTWWSAFRFEHILLFAENPLGHTKDLPIHIVLTNFPQEVGTRFEDKKAYACMVISEFRHANQHEYFDQNLQRTKFFISDADFLEDDFWVKHRENEPRMFGSPHPVVLVLDHKPQEILLSGSRSLQMDRKRVEEIREGRPSPEKSTVDIDAIRETVNRLKTSGDLKLSNYFKRSLEAIYLDIRNDTEKKEFLNSSLLYARSALNLSYAHQAILFLLESSDVSEPLKSKLRKEFEVLLRSNYFVDVEFLQQSSRQYRVRLRTASEEITPILTYRAWVEGGDIEYIPPQSTRVALNLKDKAFMRPEHQFEIKMNEWQPLISKSLHEEHASTSIYYLVIELRLTPPYFEFEDFLKSNRPIEFKRTIRLPVVWSGENYVGRMIELTPEDMMKEESILLRSVFEIADRLKIHLANEHEAQKENSSRASAEDDKPAVGEIFLPNQQSVESSLLSAFNNASALEIAEDRLVPVEIAGDWKQLVPDDFFSRPISIQELLEHFKDRPLVVSFGAKWCGPCKAALRNSKVVMKEYEDRGLIILNFQLIDNLPSKIEKSTDGTIDTIESLELNFPTLLLYTETQEALGILEKGRDQSYLPIPAHLYRTANGEWIAGSSGGSLREDLLEIIAPPTLRSLMRE